MATGFFFYSNNAPDAKVILNRGTEFEYDITPNMISFNTTNDVNTIFGNFTVVMDNTNDNHVDRFGVVDVTPMSSIEIFVKSNVAKSNTVPVSLDSIPVSTKEGQSISSIIDDIYGLSNYPTNNGNMIQDYKSSYLEKILDLNPGKTLKFVGGTTIPITALIDISTVADYELTGGQNLNFPPPITIYKRVFLGVVTNVQQSFTAGSAMTISITGESFGYWLKISNVNIAPGLTEAGTMGVSTAQSSQLTNYSNKYADKKALEIFRDLLQASTNDTLTVANFTFGTTYTTYENLQATKNLDKDTKTLTGSLGDTFKDPVTGTALTLNQAFGFAYHKKGIPIPTTYAETLTALDSLESSVSTGTYLDGTDIQTLNIIPKNTTDTVKQECIKYQDLSKSYDKSLKEFESLSNSQTNKIVDQEKIIANSKTGQNGAESIKAKASITTSKKKIDDKKKEIENNRAKVHSNPIVQHQTEVINTQRKKFQDKINNTQSNGRKVLEQLGIMQVWRQIFSQMVLEVANESYLQRVYPFKTIIKSPAMLDGDYQSKSTVAKQVSDALNFEFYMDTNGHFVLKPPLYNIGIPNDDPSYIIEQEDIISMNINDTIDGMITRIGVTGDVLLPVQLERIMTYNVHVDLNLVGKYGVHNTELQNLIFLRTPQDCKDYGESYMAKNNQELKNATITVLGRPDIRLGVACYLKPRDTVYYIKSISHDFSVGGQYTTTITLSGARRIIVGYKVSSIIQVVTQTVIDGITMRSTKNVAKDGVDAGTITHYILANSLSPAVQLANFNDSYGSPLQQFSPVRNSYIIVSHPNLGYVGLVVDQDNIIYNDINYNTFKYIYRAAQGPITNSLIATTENIDSNFGKNKEPYKIIMGFLVDFIIKNNIGGQGSKTQEQLSKLVTSNTNANYEFNLIANKFNQAILNDYISSFLNFIEAESVKTRGGNNVEQTQILATTASYFNIMLMEVNTLGAYRAYTDENGREFPALLNYGQGLKVEHAEISINEDSAAKNATNPVAKTNSQVDEIIRYAKQYGGQI